MRERLVVAFVGFTVAVVALIGIPRAYMLADLVQAQEERKVERSADLAAVLVREKVSDGRPVTPELLDALLHEGERLEYVAADGSRTISTRGADGSDDLVAKRVLPDGGTVTLGRSGDLVKDRVAQALLPLVLIVLLLVLVAAGAGWAIARRMARPFQRLAAAAQQLGTGDLELDLPRFRVPEADRIGTALSASARQVDALLAQEREVAAHASHELRTPITALRLDLEDLTLWPQTPPDVAAELARSLTELDRLSDAVSTLLDRSEDRRHQATVDVDLAALVSGAVDRAARAAAGSVDVTLEQTGPVPARLDRANVAQVLDLLLADACVPDTRVSVAVADLGSHLEVRVASSRPRRDPGIRNADGARRLVQEAGEHAAVLGGQVMSVPTSAGEALVLRLPPGRRTDVG